MGVSCWNSVVPGDRGWRALFPGSSVGYSNSRSHDTSHVPLAGAREASSGPAPTAAPFGHPSQEFLLVVGPLELLLVLVESGQQVAG